jgi:hypothetical protein
MGVRTDEPTISYGYQYPVRALKVGMILLFDVAIARIPEKWALCDGSLGTPDLRNQFILGAGGAKNPGDTGGAVNHTHDFTSNLHSHALEEGDEIHDADGFSNAYPLRTITGTTDNGNVLPPYHAIVFIKKIKRGGI